MLLLLKNRRYPQVDKSDLVDLIGDAETLKAGTPVGEEPGQAPEAAHTAFQAAIDAAKTVNENADATQEQVDDAVVTLQAAITTFEAAIVPESVEPLLFENFEGLADVDEFWTAAYKSLPGDETKPLYYQTGGTFTLVDDGLKLDGGRFTIGMPDDRGATTSADIDAGGTFDLSKPYKITVEFTGVEGTLTKKFHVYIDNNTPSAGDSIHNSIGKTASRPYSTELSGLPEGGVIELSPSVGTENSFVQLRVETSGIIVIKNFTIEHI